MEIRSVRKEDFKQVLNLLRQLNPDDQPDMNVENKIFDEIIGSKYLNLIVAENNGNIQSCCYLNIIPNITRGGRPYSVIENVITDSKHRNRGLGEAVINKAVLLSWEANCYKVMLMSGRKEQAVHSFYKKCGFIADEKQAYVQRAPQ